MGYLSHTLTKWLPNSCSSSKFISLSRPLGKCPWRSTHQIRRREKEKMRHGMTGWQESKIQRGKWGEAQATHKSRRSKRGHPHTHVHTSTCMHVNAHAHTLWACLCTHKHTYTYTHWLLVYTRARACEFIVLSLTTNAPCSLGSTPHRIQKQGSAINHHILHSCCTEQNSHTNVPNTRARHLSTLLFVSIINPQCAFWSPNIYAPAQTIQ